MRARVGLGVAVFLAAALCAGEGASSEAARASPSVVVGRIETPIHPAAAGYLKKLLDDANADGAALVVLTLSTPGGLLASTREMSSAILASKVPVVTYVSPAGASAASAGKRTRHWACVFSRARDLHPDTVGSDPDSGHFGLARMKSGTPREYAVPTAQAPR